MATDARSRALAALGRFVVSEASLADTLTHVASITTAALPTADFAGMSLLDEEGHPTTAIFTSDESPRIDAAQYASGDGPCLDAWRTGRNVRIDDVHQETARYREFREASLEHGIHSTLSVPLLAGEESLGALNMYSSEVNGFTEEDEALAGELAAVAAVLLANSTAYWGAYELSQQLNEALGSRSTIDQAKGMLMAQTIGLDADGAFDVLKKASQRENVKIRDIAARIIERRTP
ncbi:MAG: Response regulator with antiterminator output domain [Acidimicrobiales bacterium]|nr:Response regulator with antiterminator output domain [Acidimicrobiales bacterium]